MQNLTSHFYARDTRSDKMLNAASWMENHVITSDFCRMKSDGVEWNAFRSI